ncbi:putative DCL protein chloroplast precursor [Tripterygium wilfordii]|uniref:Putative DCL protein chloroplast n=1 Tax=Tripterygium wilfordii TaxID=458696 RepID=A0A7J7DLE2_TRIWF|nr:protein DCL homolog, chloroplastic-like [Tripterygium wilfordii]XP_038704336.1 protein DCL homolog, chloroplastic-like [Tripterygium wilfordii]KAF5747044.1 putative DCL protein chloroplast precursor [Tripterygium wilfordii]
MFSISNSAPTCLYSHTNPVSPSASPLILSFQFHWRTSLHSRPCALRTGSEGSDVLRKPVSRPPVKESEIPEEEEEDDLGSKDEEIQEDDELVDWEDQILADTVPLVGFVRMILHSGKYRSGDRLSPEHESTIINRLLCNHPEYEKKIGCGIDYITVGYHPNFESSKCLFIVRKDGELVDFSYWKCIKGLIRKNYPLYADSFILRHFRSRRNDR